MDRQIDPDGQMQVDSAARLSIPMNLSFTNCFIGVINGFLVSKETMVLRRWGR